MRIKKLDILILRSYFLPLLGTFFIVLFIQLMQFLWKYIDDLVGKGLEWNIIGQLVFYISATFVPMALPLGILLASLMTFGNLGENYELVAMKSAGISLKRIMWPLIIVSFLMSAFAFFFANNIMPKANLKAMALLHDVRSQKPAVNIKEGVFYNEIDGYVIKVGNKDKDGKTIRNILIYDHTKRSGNANLTIAQWGRMEITPDNRYLIFTLFNGTNYYERTETREQSETRPMQRTRFREQYRRIDLSAFAFEKTNEELFKDHHYMLNVRQLAQSLDTLQIEINTRLQEFSRYMVSNFTTITYLDSLTLTKPSIPMHLQDKNVKSETLVELVPMRPLRAFGALSHREPENLEVRTPIDESVVTKENFDSTNFLGNFPIEKQRQIIEGAINQVQNILSTADMSNMDYITRVRTLRKHEVELHRKFSLSLACLLLFFIGAPLGAIIRKGGLGLPVVVSILFFVFYYVLSITGEKFAKESIWDAWVGMWLSSAIILPLGIFLTYKATSDSPLLDAESWQKIIKRLNLKKH